MADRFHAILQQRKRLAGRGYSVRVCRLLLRSAEAAGSHALLALTSRDDKMIVIAVVSPGARRHVPHFHKLPVGHIRRRQPKIITDCRGNIQSGPVIKIRFRTLVAEDVLKMVCAKRSTIFPLRIANAISFTNSDPTIAANGLQSLDRYS